ncbi:MAG: thioredoxin-disulfide reductase [Desulfobacterales bacterium]|nr:thioredoxin-disulfide reductase [Desulfobacterales bacterium]
MKTEDFDLVIIGGGPGGLTAGMYASRARRNTLLIEKAAPGGQILMTDWMENYPGFPEGLTGFDLVQKMKKQAEKFGLALESNEVMSLDLTGPVKTIHMTDRSITAYAVILATGATPIKLGVPGEGKFFGRGVSTCATCDAPFYKGRTVVAVGGGDTAVQESLYLTKFAKKVYLVHRRDQLRATKILQERILENDRVEILWDSALTEINGFNTIEHVKVENIRTQETTTLPVEGCFVWVGTFPNTGFLNGAITLDPSGYIVADAHMETSVPGVFAVGDVRDTPLRQVATAVGDGAIAATSADHYIDEVKARMGHGNRPAPETFAAAVQA